MRFLIATVLTMFMAVAAFAGHPVDGKWEGEADSPQGKQALTFVFKEVDGKLTGSLESFGQSSPIENAKLKGKSLSFDQSFDYGGRKIVMSYKGKIKDDTIEFSRDINGKASEFAAKRKVVDAASALKKDELLLAFDEILDSAKAAGELILNNPFYDDDQSRAEGIRMLAEYTANAMNILFTDTDYPHFVLPDPQHRSFGLPNPHSQYQAASINGEAENRMWCTRGTTADLVIQAVSPTNYGKSGGSAITLETLKLKSDNTFDVVLSTERPASCSEKDCNWLNTSGGANIVFVRYTHNDWANERPGRCHIEQVDKVGVSPEPLTSEKLMEKMATAKLSITGQVQLWDTFAQSLKNRLRPNTLWPPREHSADGLKGKYHSQGYFELEEGQAMVIERVPPEIEGGSQARFSGIDIGNFWWVGLDAHNRQTSLTTGNSYAWPGEDGIAGTADDKIRWVISKTDPGVKNWIDTDGRDSGWITIRWQGANPAAMPPSSNKTAPKVQLVNVKDLPKILAKDEFISGPEERKAQIKARQDNWRERYTGWNSAPVQ